MEMTYQEAQDVLALSAEHEGDPTAEMIEATEVMVKQANLTRVSKQYLADTDWVAAKFVDEVQITQRMTAADFNAKYADVLAKRKAARDTIL
ncbi:MAG: hypothetical protein JXR47_05230 [Thiotrichales bacterium]|nr:hypothetical protein [Thiotrichales bacterium]